MFNKTKNKSLSIVSRCDTKIDCSKNGIAVFVDVETTGLSPVADEIVELALCLFLFDRKSGEIIEIIEEYTALRDPGRSIPAAATRIHGIRNMDVKGKYLDFKCVKRMFDRAEFIIAHNAPFDRGFIQRLFPETRKKIWMCSMRHINWRERGYSSRGLQNLIKYHGIKVDRAHRAADDVKAAVMLLSQFDKNGQPYLLEMLEQLP